MNAINIGMIVAVGLAASVHQASAEPAYAVNTSGSLILIDTATPATVVGTVPVSGLQPGDQLVGIDFRPATRTL